MKMNFGKLSTKELASLCQRVIVVSGEDTSAVVKNHPLLSVLETVYNEYSSVYAKKAFSGKSELVAEADKKRDTIFAGLKDILIGYSKLSFTPNQQLAIEIYAIIEKYDIALDRYNYAEESAQLNKLLEELALPINAAKLEQMQLSPVVAQLKAAQTAFEELYISATNENAELRLLESATSMRKTLESALRNYFNIVKSMSSLEGWKQLYSKLSELTKLQSATHKAEGAVETAK